MNRRQFVQCAASVTKAPPATGKTHIATLSFDDGFGKSFYKIADIYEGFGLRACLNVIATGPTSIRSSPKVCPIPA